MNVPDIMKIVEIVHEKREARKHGIAVIVDSTVTTPYLFRGKGFGVDLVVHSSNKLISGRPPVSAVLSSIWETANGPDFPAF